MNTLRKSRSTAAAHGLKAIPSEGAGVYEAIVSVFGNVDLANDRMVFGAFADSLERWKSSGDPIPVVFAHQWDDLDAHVGIVLAAEELAPGDARLPAELAQLGGLLVKFRLDVEEDFAARLAKRLDRRSIREFSFAYDVVTERRSSDGVNDLVSVDLIEVGPCLKGMNPATALLARARKALGDAGDGLTDSEVLAAVTIAAPAAGKSATVTYVGSVEERQDAILAAAHDWASSGDVGRGGYYATHLEATYDDRVLILVEGWDDPIGEGIPFEAAFTFADGVATLEEPVEVIVEASTRPKGRAKNRRSAIAGDGGATVSDQSKNGKGKGKAENAEDPGTEDQDHDDDTEDGTDPVVAELDLVEAELEDVDEPPAT